MQQQSYQWYFEYWSIN